MPDHRNKRPIPAVMGTTVILGRVTDLLDAGGLIRAAGLGTEPESAGGLVA